MRRFLAATAGRTDVRRRIFTVGGHVTTTRQSSSKAVALDIDGVFLRGGHPLPRAADAMKLLAAASIPFVFVTNGGGITEAAKAEELTKKLGVSVLADQVILSHTPFREIAAQHKNDRVLVLGKEDCLKVAASYGFTKAVSAKQLHEESPTLYPLRRPGNAPTSTHAGEPVRAVMIFHDPVDWGLEIQVVTDVLLGRQQYSDVELRNVAEVAERNVPFFVSNADLVYTSDHPHPRFTQGAFVEAFKSLYEMYAPDSELRIVYCGKPFKVQYEAAAAALSRQMGGKKGNDQVRYYGIGDNPRSDIRGANAAGDAWTSILVRSGVFDGADNDRDDPADVVVEDILDAVQHILADK